MRNGTYVLPTKLPRSRRAWQLKIEMASDGDDDGDNGDSDSDRDAIGDCKSRLDREPLAIGRRGDIWINQELTRIVLFTSSLGIIECLAKRCMCQG